MTATRDWLVLAERTLGDSPGYNEGQEDGVAAAEALVGIGFELRRIADALEVIAAPPAAPDPFVPPTDCDPF